MAGANAIEARGLTKRFRGKTAVGGLDLQVPRGCVFALAGPNGAGKTTTIRMLLGLLRPTSGLTRVLGLDPAADSVALRRKVGYVPETHRIYSWMTVGEVLGFCAPFYPTWSRKRATELLARFDLKEDQRVKELSRGMVAKVALTLALAHEPELLILDEPTSGLDVIVRREFLESIVSLVCEEGRTVLISSHNLADVERVAERIAFLDAGRLVLVEDLASLKARFRQVGLAFADEPPADLSAEGVLTARRDGRRWELVFDRFGPTTLQELSLAFPSAHVEERSLSLEDIFVVLMGGSQGQGH